MQHLSRVFQLPKDSSHESISKALSDTLGLDLIDTRSVTRHYLDSYDWRVFNNGFILEADQLDDHVRLTRRALKNGSNDAADLRQQLPSLPATAADFRSGELRDWLAKQLDLRALISIASMRCHIERYALRNQDEKIVARVEYQRDRIGRSDDLAQRLLVLPLRGYESQAEKLGMRIPVAIDVKNDNTEPFFLAVAATDRTPGDYSQKPDFQLNPYQRADAAARDILLQLFAAVEQNKAGTIAQTDTEFLHDLRVAVRRSRSLLSQMKNIFPEARVERFKRDLAWVGSITTPGRDMDVYLLDFEALRSDLPKSMGADLDPLWDFLVRHHAEAYCQLGEDLNSSRYRRFAADWVKFLETDSPRISSLSNAMRPLKQVSDERIWKIYRKVIKEGRQITDDSPNDDLHELRKTCKKLRYMMEFFRNLYLREEITASIKELKRLQDFLGLFQDLEVQSEKLHEFSEQMREEGLLPEATEAAMKLLADHMSERQIKTRGKFGKLFRQFSSAENSKHFRGLFKS